jgi:hypothetical protein
MKTKNPKLKSRLLLCLLLLSTFNPQLSTLFAQGTAFTYQGRLNDGTNPANGNYDLQFAIYDAASAGTQQGVLLTNSATGVTNGLFTVTLDFGNQFVGADRFLEVAVRTNGAASFTVLTPRQKLAPSPYAITAGNLAGVIANNTVGAAYATVSGGSNNAVNGAYSTASGGYKNTIQTNDAYATIGGGYDNTVQGFFSYGTIGGGIFNIVSGGAATVGGGDQNTASGGLATVAGGNVNVASGNYATVGGGGNNSAGGFAATVPGGWLNSAAGDDSFAAGFRGKANHAGTFVWADSTIADFASTTSNQFLIRAGGGVGIGTPNPQGSLHIYSDNNPTVVRIQSSGTPGFGRVEFVSNPQGDPNEWRPAYIQSLDAGGFTGGLGFYVNGTGIGNKFAANEVMRIINGTVGINKINPATALDVNGTVTATSFSGNGAGLAGVNANSLEGFDSTNLWKTTGNTGTAPGANFIGTADNQALELKANNARALRLEPNVNSPNLIGGYSGNVVSNGFAGATIGGGGFAGNENRVGGNYATTSGGAGNNVSGNFSTVGGGLMNTASSAYATVPGGQQNLAAGEWSFAAGRFAFAQHDGAFVWADDNGSGFSSTSSNQFCIRAGGGVRLNTDTSLFFGSQTRQMINLWGTNYAIGVQTGTAYFRCDGASINNGFAWYRGGSHNDGQTNAGGGVTLMTLNNGGLTVNGTFVSSSDRNQKEHFEAVNTRDVLDKVAALPLTTWSYRQDTASRHLGPMAQDFYAAFNVGADDKHIAVVDEGGVALAAIQGLNQKLTEELKRRDAENAELKARLEALERIIRKQIPN